MKRYITLLLLLCGVSFTTFAQVAKQVEVTKDYAPEIGEARKMDIAPNMVDTITLRPEIDYTITPRSFASALGTHRFKPATVTYWEYRRQYPFYLKLGAGYPLNTVGDLYATTHRADVGYLTGYINHYGQYQKLRYKGATDEQIFKDNRSMQMKNKFGVMGGKYFGRYTLAGNAYYSMDIYHRYPLHNEYDESGNPLLEYKRRKVSHDDLKVALSFGDSFADYSHLNFKVYAAANFFNDKSELFVKDDRYQQINVVAGGAIAREVNKKVALALDIDYEGYYGLRSLKEYKNSIASAQLMCHYRSGRLVDLKVGARVLYDNNPADAVKQNRWHAFPYMNVSLNISEKGYAVPYVEVGGELQNNSYYSLAQRNPYVAILGDGFGMLQRGSVLPNTELYNVRFGISGHTLNSKFAYRFYANMSFMKNALYWYNVNRLFFDAVAAKQNVWSLCAAVDYKPISQLLIMAEVKGSLYDNFAEMGDVQIANTLPDVEASLKIRYNHKKFTVGASADLRSKTRWTYVEYESLYSEIPATTPVAIGRFEAPLWVGLNLYADYKVGKACTIFAEGNNLLGDAMPTYRWAFYREMGASFTVGVKVQF